MSILDFVCDHLKVPVDIDGYNYSVKAIKFVVENSGDSRFYDHLCEQCGKSRGNVERCLRFAKSKAIASLSDVEYSKIYPIAKEDLTAKQFICYAALYYRRLSNED